MDIILRNESDDPICKQIADQVKAQIIAGRLTAGDYLKYGQDYQQRILMPYLKKLGNCKLISLPGDHLIYETKPDECGQIIADFIRGLDS